MARVLFACAECEYQSPKWLGRCPGCGAWNSLAEIAAPGTGTAPRGPVAEPTPLAAVRSSDARRRSTGIPELDRVLGGGLVPGMAVLIGGEPGIGKSTLVLQAASSLSDGRGGVLYVTGEESLAQLRLRSERLGVERCGLAVMAETDTDTIVEAVRREPPIVLVVDSIQTVRCPELPAVPGSIGQVRESAGRLVELAKSTGVALLLVGHATKEGSIAGPRALEHVVDTVLQFEGERHHAHRVLRTLKNRFGSADEIGVFAMTETGLRGVANPSELFLDGRPESAPGSVVLAAIEGTRPMLVEIQALVGEEVQGTPRRTSLGIDGNRVALILAVLQRCAGLPLGQRDVFVNVAGGLSLQEPAADLAVALAIASSHRGRPLPPGWVVFGEIGLAGEIRSVGRGEARLREAERLGFVTALAPTGAPAASPALELREAGSITRALELAFAQIG